MSSSPWKTFLASQLQTNIERVGLSATYVSLATVRPDGTPANRTVVFRGFAGEDHRSETGWQSELLTVTSAKRSRKMADIAAQPMVELSWFMAGTQEQFRVHGRMVAVQAGTTSDALRGVLPDPVTKKGAGSAKDTSASSSTGLATRAFLTRLSREGAGDNSDGGNTFDWQVERLRQWYRMNDQLRGTFPEAGDGEPLAIENMDNEGWFVNHDPAKQKLLEAGYENFALLVMQVESVDYVNLTTGEHSVFIKPKERQEQAMEESSKWVFKRLS
ncbi:pyridoxamine 5'-phosphate oxidase-domain-containing protein [Zychaea mexicana]|uniref:pyridoxamine 5'-phosphate oxidase-domain-containing protein n=1 Tax=Zychaea mexicana TaxID=64656 RepID=UPI0022FE3AF0|nr:pyridoxamine 5'-phosphate oxidase-domain-containing protein [Zychaea mexicana]KAI9489950.1 pyridoxamine 5'-phosphate oxidase-domain-containing protein [Zychaea mexicana]